jgi:RecA-family ATPase
MSALEHPYDYQSAKNGEWVPREPTRLVKGNLLTANIEPNKWLVKSIIPDEGLLEFVGASGSYKSFLLIDMMFCISAGIEYHGKKTNKGTVVYVAGEGANGIKMRLKALELHYMIQDYDFYVLPMPSNLIDKSEVEKLSCDIALIAPDGVSMVMFDTLHRNSAGSDENSSKDFAVMLGYIDKLIKPISKVVGWVHHTGLGNDAQERGRGTSSRYGAMDTVILIEKTSPLNASISNTKQKDAEEFKPMNFELTHINLGIQDEDGIDLKSLVPIMSASIPCTKCTDNL